ncbi:hypothetical protein J8J40_22120, partial [Mycobacterium tuberculosis]|nr:hypothetical protein [Mycobacterium tuberculosis]
MDPGDQTATFTAAVLDPMYEGLLRRNAELKLEPALATEWSSDAAGLVWTFKLRPGVTFHDGAKMTSADVVASLNRWMKIASRGKQVAGFIASIAADGPLGVKITLKEPYAPLLAFLAFNNAAAIVVPAANAAEDTLSKIVG